MTPEEKQKLRELLAARGETEEEARERELQMQMMDWEFTHGVEEFGGPTQKGKVDPDVVDVVQSPDVLPLRINKYRDDPTKTAEYANANAGPAGFFIGRQFDESDLGDGGKAGERYKYQREAGLGTTLSDELERGKVYAGSGKTATSRLFSHEFRHKGDENLSETAVRMWNGYRSNARDFEEEASLLGGLDTAKRQIAVNLPKLVEQEARAALENDIRIPGLPDNEYDEQGKMEVYSEWYLKKAVDRHPWLRDFFDIKD